MGHTMETRKAEGIDMFATIVAVMLAFLAGVTASNGATIIIAVLAITAAAPLTVRWRSRPTPLEAIRRTVNRPD